MDPELAARGGGGGDGGVPRVLVVDDHEDTADALEMYLRRVGYDARAAYCGTQALALARGFTPQLAILDLRLPDMSGLELAGRLRAEAGSRTMWLVALSGVADPSASSTPFDAVACKPIDPRALCRLLGGATVRRAG